jgi:hypothetical protein
MSNPQENVKAPRQKREPVDEIVAFCRDDEVLDSVSVLRPTVPRNGVVPMERFPGKRYFLKDGKIGKPDFNRGGWHSLTTCLVGGDRLLRSVHAAFEYARLEGAPACAVLGVAAPGSDWRGLPRSKKAEPAKRDEAGKVTVRARPAGLVDAKHFYAFLDLDHVPSGGIDPRTRPAEALERVRMLFPPAIAEADISWRWSGSTCMRADDASPLGDRCPDEVGLHVIVVLSERLDEAGRKELALRLGAYVSARCPGAFVDPAAAVYNQSLFCRVSLEGGCLDPFPGSLRSGILPGEPFVDMDRLNEQMPDLGLLVRSLCDEGRKERAAATRACKARAEHDGVLRGAARLVRQEDAGASDADCDLPSDPPKLRKAPLSRAYARGKAARIADRKDVFRQRALNDIYQLVRGRKASGDPLWSEGVPDGMRTRTLWAIGALLSWVYPSGDLESEMCMYARMLMTRRWYLDSFAANGRGKKIVEDAILAEQTGAPERRQDRCKLALMRLLSPTQEEQIRYGLRALRTDAVRAVERRAAKGIPTIDESRKQRLEQSVKVSRPWVAAGVSRTQWFENQKASRAAAADLPPAPVEPTFTAAGIRTIGATLELGWGTRSVTVAADAMRGLGAPEVAEAIAGSNAEVLDTLRTKVSQATGSKKEVLGTFTSAMEVLTHGANGASGSDSMVELVEYIIDRPKLSILARTAKDRGPRIASRSTMVEFAAGFWSIRAITEALREWSETGIRPAAQAPKAEYYAAFGASGG